jgi:O-antigen/teichoic acid export membrane protein
MRELALKGLKWSFIQQIANQVVNYGAILYLATKVLPELHGLVTIGSIPGGFIGIIGALGLREKIIKDRALGSDVQAAYFGFILVASFVIFFLTLGLSVVVSFAYAADFDAHTIFKTSMILSVIPSVSIISSYFEALQFRLFKFRQSSIINIWSIIIGSILAVILANLGYGYFALILKLVGPHICILFGWIILYKGPFHISWKPSLYKEFKKFTVFYTLNSIANFFVRNVDYIIIGKFFPAAILGQYTIAYKILLFPMKNITSNIQGVMLPILSTLNYDSRRFRDRFFLIVTFISFIVFPLMTFISVSATDWVPLFFNSSYTAILPMIILLAIVGAFQAVISPVGVLYILKERSKTMFINTIIIAILMTICFLISSIFLSINWVVINFVIVWLAMVMPLSVFVAYKIFNFTLLDFIRSVSPAILSSLLAILSYLIVKNNSFSKQPVFNLITGGILFSSIYLLSYQVITRRSEKSISNFLSFLKKRA